MKFSEKLNAYQKGTLSEDEAKEIAKEIERHESISSYLADELDEKFSPSEEDFIESALDLKKISRKVNFKIARLVVLLLFLVFILVFSIFKFSDWYYYDPNEGIASQYGNGQFFLDTMVFTELHFPGYITSYGEAMNQGLGKYQIQIGQQDTFSGQIVQYSDQIIRGHIPKHIEDFWKFPYANAFSDKTGSMVHVLEDGSEQSKQPEEEKAYYLTNLQSLPESCLASTFFSFDQELTLEEFADLHQKWNSDIYFSYVAIRNRDGDIPTVIGFEPSGSGTILEKNTLSEKEYPYLQLANYQNEWEANPAEIWEIHFKTLLTYMKNHPDYLKVMGAVNGIDVNYYQDVLDYIDANGMMVYGVLVHADITNTLLFEAQENVSSIFVKDVKLPLSH